MGGEVLASKQPPVNYKHNFERDEQKHAFPQLSQSLDVTPLERQHKYVRATLPNPKLPSQPYQTFNMSLQSSLPYGKFLPPPPERSPLDPSR